MQPWVVPPDWAGETAFVVAGGPSFGPGQAERLRGRRVIAINSAWRSVPWAEVLFFSDPRWFETFGAEGFGGRIVGGCDIPVPGSLWLRKVHPPGLARNPREVAFRRTSVSGAINLAWHLGSPLAVLLGVDGRPGADGALHHHGVRYPWPVRPDSFDAQRAELEALAAHLGPDDIAVVNANPDSAVRCFPFVALEAVP